MSDELELAILERMQIPGWTTTRAVLQDPNDQLPEEDHRRVREAMERLARRGLVTLWRLKLTRQPVEMLAAAKPELELDKDLEQRGAWATAARIESIE